MARTSSKASVVSKKSPPRKRQPKEETPNLVPSTVLGAVTAEVEKLPVSLRGSALALTALHLAKILSLTYAARDSASLAKELRAVLADLAVAVSRAGDKSDRVDELTERRKLRRAKAGM